jgi:biotin carboxyl carrier protein
MRRKFRVTVDGETFQVEVEEVTEGSRAPRTEVAGQQELDRAVPTRVEPTTGTMEDGVVTAPLPGVVSELRVSEGDRVEAGSVLLVLEAMKMENEIYAPISGVVGGVYVEVGQQVGKGDRLVLVS